MCCEKHPRGPPAAQPPLPHRQSWQTLIASRPYVFANQSGSALSDDGERSIRSRTLRELRPVRDVIVFRATFVCEIPPNHCHLIGRPDLAPPQNMQSLSCSGSDICFPSPPASIRMLEPLVTPAVLYLSCSSHNRTTAPRLAPRQGRTSELHNQKLTSGYDGIPDGCYAVFEKADSEFI